MTTHWHVVAIRGGVVTNHSWWETHIEAERARNSLVSHFDDTLNVAIIPCHHCTIEELSQ